MPLSKPVKKQQLLLPGPKDFRMLGQDKREHILSRLSTDNLIIYLEYIVSTHHTQTKSDCFTLEQIVEDDIQLGSSCSDEDIFISKWITKNANRNNDLEDTFMDQNNNNGYTMTSTKAITQALLGTPNPKIVYPKNDLRNIFQDVNNFSSNSSQSSSFGQNYGTAISPSLSRGSRAKSAWDNLVAPSSGSASRWQNNLAENKENVPQFKAAIERPSSGLDLRFEYDSPPFAAKSHGLSKSTSKVSSHSAGKHLNGGLFEMEHSHSFSNFGGSARATREFGSLLMSDPPNSGTLFNFNGGMFAAHNLPEPSVFNAMNAESRAQILSNVPSLVKNKYEYYCWSYKLSQLYSERPNFNPSFP